MTLPRFFVRPEAIQGDRVRFDPDETRHLARVRRLRAGDLVEVTDGAGGLYLVRLDAVESPEAVGTLAGPAPGCPESPLAVTLAAALLRPEPMTWLVQKATELGVARLAPMLTERGVARPDHDRSRTSARWIRVARESTKQCGRAVAPLVDPLRPLADVLARSAEHDATWLLWEHPDAPALQEVVAGSPVPRRLLLLVGPEGGFSDREVALARGAGAVPVGLGPRILRAESAGLVAVALAQFLFGDVGRATRVSGSTVEAPGSDAEKRWSRETNS